MNKYKVIEAVDPQAPLGPRTKTERLDRAGEPDASAAMRAKKRGKLYFGLRDEHPPNSPLAL